MSRDPSVLDADELPGDRAESVAENTSDAVVAPLLWGAVAGVPGLLGYRAANTLDAMVGYRNERYLQFGWASARLDDVLNWYPPGWPVAWPCSARPSWAASGHVPGARSGNRRPLTPSPNAGVVESAFAGALGVRLGGRNVYGGVV